MTFKLRRDVLEQLRRVSEQTGIAQAQILEDLLAEKLRERLDREAQRQLEGEASPGPAPRGVLAWLGES